MGRLLNIHLGAVYAFLYLPIAVLMVLSLNASGLPTAWTGITFDWYGKLFSNPKIIASAWNSLVVAFWSTLIATVLGTMLALGVARAKASPSRDALLFAPMIIPDIVLAIALLSFFTLVRFSLGLRSIVLAHVVFNIAFVCAVVRARLAGYDWSLNEAARDLGASAWTGFWTITFPLIRPSVIAGALLAFTLSIDEFIIAYFTAGAGQASTTLPMQIYAMIRFGVTPEINAMATIVMGMSFVLVFAAQRLNRGRLPGT